MNYAEQEADLREALETWELTLETPVVPGELRYWSDAVYEGFQKVECALRPKLDQVHRDQFKKIRKEDLALAKRVEQLQADDDEIRKQLAYVSERIEALRRKAPTAEPDELKAKKEHDGLADDALGLVIRIRKQETAIGTWLTEAFSRDRGDVD